MNNKGFTVVELIVTIAVIAIFATVGIINLTGSMTKKQLEADEMSIFQLDDATESYALVSGTSLDSNSSDFVFSDCYLNGALDYDLMSTKLMDNGYLLFRPQVESKNAEFQWDTAAQEWKLVFN